MIKEKLSNALWAERSGRVSVLIPCYNRRKTIGRTLLSIEAQSYRDVEVIVVDDGSTESSDDIIQRYMESSAFPVLYLKKENGGVHTARNAGTQEARGEFLINVDSDDELLPDAIRDLLHAWEQIPASDRPQYREVVGRCVDDAGKLIGAPLPQDINTFPWKDALAASRAAGGEREALFVTAIMKQHLFPEPEGVTFVPEDFLWNELEKEYKSYFIDTAVRIYHSDSGNQLTAPKKKKSIQTVRNRRWSLWYTLENAKNTGLLPRCRKLLAYAVTEALLRRLEKNQYRAYALTGTADRLLCGLFRLPAIFAALIYQGKHHIS